MQGLVERTLSSESRTLKMDFFESLAALELNPELHCARLLILLEAFANEEGTGEVEGVTKLAKLDFLLRYPVMLERALLAKRHSAKVVGLLDHERNSVESKMVRYRFGPWDHRYPRLLSLLQAKGLVQMRMDGVTKMVGLTPQGAQLGKHLGETEEFAAVARRARLLKRYFDMPATRLMRFVYATFPEIASLELNTAITP
jgi:hypothetical protein